MLQTDHNTHFGHYRTLDDPGLQAIVHSQLKLTQAGYSRKELFIDLFREVSSNRNLPKTKQLFRLFSGFVQTIARSAGWNENDEEFISRLADIALYLNLSAERTSQCSYCMNVVGLNGHHSCMPPNKVALNCEASIRIAKNLSIDYAEFEKVWLQRLIFLSAIVAEWRVLQ